MPTFGVFVWRNSKWWLVSTWTNKTDATQELAYLRDMLGLTAQLFIEQ